MNETPLHQLGDYIRDSLSSIPLTGVRWLFLGLIVFVFVLVIRLPNHETIPQRNGKIRWDENLKVWALLALIVQFVIYLIF